MPSYNRERGNFTLHCCRKTDIIAPDNLCVGEAVLTAIAR